MGTVDLMQDRREPLLDRLQDRWDLDPSFRATVSLGVSAAVIILLVACVVLTASSTGRIIGALTGGGSSTINTNPNAQAALNGSNPISTFTVPPPTPGAPPNYTGAQPIPSSNQAVPTPTVPPTPLPVPGQTPTATALATGTPTTTGTVTTTQYPAPTQNPYPWLAGSTAYMSWQTDATQANKQVTIALDFSNNGQNQGCASNLSTNLDQGGGLNNYKFTVPGCFKGGNQFTVNAIFTIQGSAPMTYTFAAKGQ